MDLSIQGYLYEQILTIPVFEEYYRLYFGTGMDTGMKVGLVYS